MIKVQLIIERGDDGKLWGRVTQDDNLLTNSAKDVQTLERKMKKLLKDFHDLPNVEFQHFYDVSAFFDSFAFLNQTKIAKLSGINAGLLRQYASAVKHPSPAQAKKIEVAIRKLAAELNAVSIYAD